MKRKRKRKRHENQQKAIHQMLIDYVILSPKESALPLNSIKRVK